MARRYHDATKLRSKNVYWPVYKLACKLAYKLTELGVDTLEAGFPIALEGDFEAVDAVSRESHWVQVAALARANTLDIDGRLALERLLGGFGYDVTILDVVDAYTHCTRKSGEGGAS
ncbi:MAG: hypothetical protein JST93_24855 [Acidobacteria bacterium]|nr:hypothetical protein [Acidobacteriota bacterium]